MGWFRSILAETGHGDDLTFDAVVKAAASTTPVHVDYCSCRISMVNVVRIQIPQHAVPSSASQHATHLAMSRAVSWKALFTRFMTCMR